jgi:DNA adenine methylase
LDWLVEGEAVFLDVCVGAGSVLLHIAERHPHVRLVANDLEPLIADFWRAVADPLLVEDLCAQLNHPVTHELRQSLLANEPADIVGRAHAAVVLTRTSYSGILKPEMFGGGRDGARVERLRDRYNPKWIVGEVRRYHQLLAGRLEVLGIDAADCVRTHRETPMFLDPPYYHRAQGLYRCVPTPVEHEALAEEVRKCRKAVVTYDSCPEVEALYAGCQVDRFPVHYRAGRNPYKRYDWKNDEELVITV